LLIVGAMAGGQPHLAHEKYDDRYG